MLSSKKPFSVLAPGFTLGGPLHSIFPHLRSQLTPTKQNEKHDDLYWMTQALMESLKGIGITNPNPAVGCVLLDQQGNEISRGATQAFRGAHAERVAFDQIQNIDSLKNGTAYLTLEPCSHFGNQPPCVDLLIQSPLRRIVIARGDPNSKVNGQGIQKLIEAGKQVDLGILSHEASAWNLSFIAHQYLKRPVIVLKWAQTLDGQLADDSQNSKWISSSSSRIYTHWLRQRYDAILVGAKTFLQDTPQLTVRHCTPPLQNQPLPIIFDPKGILLGATEETQAILSPSFHSSQFPDRKWVYATTSAALVQTPHSWVEQMNEIIVIPLPGIDLISELIQSLESPEITQILGHPLQSLFVEGGPQTLARFMAAGYADILHTFIAPMISGGARHRISGVSANHLLTQAKRFELITSFQLESDVVMEMTSSDLLQKVFTTS